MTDDWTRTSGFKAKLDRWIERGPPEDPELCVRCGKYTGADPDVFETTDGDLICISCWEKGREETDDE